MTVHLEATNRRVDVIGEGIDVALRARPLPLKDSDLVMRVLADTGQSLVAAPSLLDECGVPSEPSDLEELPSMAHGRPEETFRWQLTGPAEELTTIEHRPRYVSTDMMALRASAVAGIGIVKLPLLMLDRQIDAESLVRVLSDWLPQREMIHAVFTSRRHLLPAVRAFIDFLAERYASYEVA